MERILARGATGRYHFGQPIHAGIAFNQGDYAIVRGIQFSGGGNKGIVLDKSKGTVIGGTEPGQANVFSITEDAGYPSTGVEITGGSSQTDVRGNYFGTKDGQNVFITPGEYGVYLTNGDNTIRDNLIVGQKKAGILSQIEGQILLSTISSVLMLIRMMLSLIGLVSN